MKTVVLLSGGMNSVTLVKHLRKVGREVLALSARFGDSNRVAIDYAEHFCLRDKVELREIQLRDIYEVTGGTPEPSRMFPIITLLDSAVDLAVSEGCSSVAYGSSISRKKLNPVLLHTLEDAIQIATDGRITVESPYKQIEKSDVFNIAMRGEVSVDLDATWNCDGNQDLPCGECPGCKEFDAVTY